MLFRRVLSASRVHEAGAAFASILTIVTLAATGCETRSPRDGSDPHEPDARIAASTDDASQADAAPAASPTLPVAPSVERDAEPLPPPEGSSPDATSSDVPDAGNLQDTGSPGDTPDGAVPVGTGTPDAAINASDASEGGTPDPTPGAARCPALDDAGVDDVEAPIVAAAGFVDVEGVDYTFHNNANTSTATRLFYSLQPADADSETAPVFLFFNGGPGSATSSLLQSYGTGPYTLPGDLSSSELAANPASWTQLGNLLYFDARMTGFSYSQLPDPSDEAARAAELGTNNFNAGIDAGDFVRALLGVFDAHPALRNNPIVLVGESYGGIRSTLMLSYLLNPTALDSPWFIYRDPSLMRRIQAHHCSQLPGEVISPDNIAKQFRAQVLIQPYIGYTQGAEQEALQCLPGTPEQEIADALNEYCPADSRSPYHQGEPVAWFDEVTANSGAMLGSLTSLGTLLGTDPVQIDGLGAATRGGAFRDMYWPATPMSEEFTSALGELPAWDTYHQAAARPSWGVYADPVFSEPDGCHFLLNVQYVNTFVTNAKFDLAVRTSALEATLEACGALFSQPILDDVALDSAPRVDVARPGWMQLHLSAAAAHGAGTVEVRWPEYAQSGHAVSVSQPNELFSDVRDFLREREIID
jgi:Serine carboxypeptidase